MLIRGPLDDLALGIVGITCSTKDNNSLVHLCAVEEPLQLLGTTANSYNKHTGSQRIESSAMTELDLDFLFLFARTFVLFGSIRVAFVLLGLDPWSECLGRIQVCLKISESLGGGDGDWLVNGWREIVSVTGL
jgi:hypothetical protein